MRLAAARSSAPAVQSVVVSADRESGCQAECLGDACPDRQADDQKDPLPACRAAAAADRVPAYRASPRHRPSSVRKTCASYSCCAFPAVHRFFHIGIVTSLYPTCRVVKSVVGRAATCRVDSCGFCTALLCVDGPFDARVNPGEFGQCGMRSRVRPLYAVRRPPALTKSAHQVTLRAPGSSAQTKPRVILVAAPLIIIPYTRLCPRRIRRKQHERGGGIHTLRVCRIHLSTITTRSIPGQSDKGDPPASPSGETRLLAGPYPPSHTMALTPPSRWHRNVPRWRSDQPL